MIRTMSKPLVVAVAVAVPLRKSFYYLWPESSPVAKVGVRVRVPFANRELIGVVLELLDDYQEPMDKLKAISECLDDQPIIEGSLLPLMLWASDYYQYPIGEALVTAMPNALRKGLLLQDLRELYWQASDDFAMEQLSGRAHKQRQIMELLLQRTMLSQNELKALGATQSVIHSLEKQGFIRSSWLEPENKPAVIQQSPLSLNAEQQAVVDDFTQQKQPFFIALLEGITGSGKTEVYLRLIAHCLVQGKQALVLVPEIGLTPQTLSRFQQRFDCEMAVFHSNLTDLQRLKYWQQARDGRAKIIIGTRSAIFTATQNLGLIVIDEEHDLSYKQQDGLRYSARDLACMRAKLENIPLVLGSATPSLETLNNAVSLRYRHWQLLQRAGKAQEPEIALLDMRKQKMLEGLAEESFNLIRQHLERQEQVLLFINRRGFAPSLLCHDCAWVGQCHACDARMTVHYQQRCLRCHHCGYQETVPHRCPQCQSQNLMSTGVGTERLEIAMQKVFPDVPLYRIDRDTTSQKNALETMVAEIHQQEAAILIGTQMLAKGHHFPNVTLVVLVDADASLVSTDYRAMERFGQLLTQVTGRAGRENKLGTAIIQTHYPKHPQLEKLIHWGYHRFAMDLLAQRQALRLPPFSAHALIRLEDQSAEAAQQTLLALKQLLHDQPCIAIGPMPASLQRRAYYFRYQLLVQSPSRSQLKQSIDYLLRYSDAIVKSHKQRWSIDVDPQDMA